MAKVSVLPLPRQLGRSLSWVKRRWKMVTAGEGCALLVSILSGLLLTAMLVDNELHLPGGVRWATFLTLCGLGATLLVRRVFWPLLWRPRDEWAAALVEQTYPELDNRLINAVQLSNGPYPPATAKAREERQRTGEKGRVATSPLQPPEQDWSGELVQALIAEAEEHVRRLDLSPVVAKERLWRRVMVAAGLVGLLAGYAAAFPTYFHNAALRLLNPWKPVMPLTQTLLQVQPGNRTVLYGEPVTVAALVQGQKSEPSPRPEVPPAFLRYRAKGGRWEQEAMTAVAAGKFVFTFEAVKQTLHYQVRAGDARSPVYTLRVVRRPFVKRLTLRYHYPPSTGLSPQTIPDSSGDILAPLGTVVTIQAVASKPLQAAYLRWEVEGIEGTKVAGLGTEGMAWPPLIPAQLIRSEVLEVQVTVTGEGTYQIHLLDRDGYSQERPLTHSVRLLHLPGGARADREGAAGEGSGPGDESKEGATPATPMPRPAAGATPPGQPGKKGSSRRSPTPGTAQEAVKTALRATREAVQLEEALIERKRELLQRTQEQLRRLDAQELADVLASQQRLEELLQEVRQALKPLLPHQYGGQLLAQLEEIVEEVEASREDLENVTIHLPPDLSILESLKQLQQRLEDLEMWLPETPDTVRWELEDLDLSGIDEVPLVELPEHLEDLIGELIEDQEDINEQTEDLSSNWATADLEAGWEVRGGPISNFSAKGKTGNTLPDDTDVTGRSGEGRSGRSHGELVQDTVRGDLGGRRTPTRITKDPFERQFVPEQTPSPTGGATGGGKQSGESEWGLPGDAPLQLLQQWRALALAQAKLRVKAELLRQGLDLLSYPTPPWEAVVALMRAREEALRQGRIDEALRTGKAVVEALQTARQATGRTQVRRDSWFAPRTREQRFLDALDEQVPPEYRELVKKYYEYLSDAATQ